MKLENQVCTLEQAEKLFNLGVKCEDPQYVFVERLREMQLANVSEFNRWACQYNEPSVNARIHYPAFNVAELGVMLNNGYQVDRSTFGKTKGKFYIFGTENDFDYYDTEAQARAAKLISAIEREMRDIETVNQRLQA